VRPLILVFAVVSLLAFAGVTAVAGPAIPAGAAPSTKTAPALTPAAEARRKELEAAVPRVVEAAAKLIDAGKRRDAWTLLLNLRNQLGEPRDVRVETLLAKIALAENRPDEAFKLVAPWANNRDTYDPHLADCYLVAADAQLALGKNNVALVIFDWTASKAQGEPLVLAAEGCGKALMALKDFRRAVECFDFAVKAVKSIADDYGTYDKLTARLRQELARARRLADTDLYGEDFVLYRDAETLRRIQKKYPEARQTYQAILKRFPDGPYADASTLYAAMCLIEMEKPQEAGRELVALWHANRYGPYAGEAMLELGRIALEYDLQPKAAKGCFLFLDAWFQEFRNQPPLEIEKRSAVPEAARKVTTPPAKEKYVDFWGNVKKSEIKPGMLINPDTCPWYLDDLKEQMAMYLGFLCFVEGDKEGALAWYKKILECDPATRRLDTAGEWNDYSRLKWGAEHGYLYAHPEELALFKDPRQRLGVLLVDLHYCTERNDEGIALCRRLLKGGAGPMRAPQRDYVWFAMGSSLQRSGRYAEALDAFEQVLQVRDGTHSERRAALGAGQLAVRNRDPKVRQRGLAHLEALAGSPGAGPYRYMAMIAIGRHLVETGLREDGLARLRQVPEEAGGHRQVAEFLIRMYTGQAEEVQN
jgi:tetratricopeptide (TPR) repeat protein